MCEKCLVMVKSKSAIHSVNLFHDWLLEYTYIDNVCLLNNLLNCNKPEEFDQMHYTTYYRVAESAQSPQCQELYSTASSHCNGVEI